MMVIIQFKFVVLKVESGDMNSLSDVKISLEVSFIFASTLGPVDNHAEFTIFTTCQGIDHFLANQRPSIG
jgi:hypothetical protein